MAISKQRLVAASDRRALARGPQAGAAHVRRCFGCGNVAEHLDSVRPWVLCAVCGSQDTRRLNTADARAGGWVAVLLPGGSVRAVAPGDLVRCQVEGVRLVGRVRSVADGGAVLRVAFLPGSDAEAQTIEARLCEVLVSGAVAVGCLNA